MAKMMRAIIWEGTNKWKYTEAPIPEIAADEVLVKVAYTGICASDVHIMTGRSGTEALLKPPRIPGHEFSGVVEDVGSLVTGIKKGDRIAPHPESGCGACYYCKEGIDNFCTNKFSTISGPKVGTFCEYTVVKPKQVYHLPDNISLQDGAMVEPTAIAVHCVCDIAKIMPPEKVLVIGAGTIGLLNMLVARLSGATLMIVSDPIGWKRDLAKKLGADIVVDPTKENLAQVCKDATKGLGMDVVIEAVGAPKAIEAAFDLLAYKGRLVIDGWPPPSKISIDPANFFWKEVEIKGAFFSPYSFQRTIDMLPSLNIKPLETHTFELKDIDKAMKVMEDGTGIKVMLKP